MAKIASVSKSTVSRALNNNPLISLATREKIQAIAKQYNFTLHKGAQSLSLQKSNTIALISPMGSDEDYSINEPYLIELLKGVIETTTKRGYDLLIGRPHSSSAKDVFRYIDSNQTDGVILIGCGISEAIKQVAGSNGVITVSSDAPASLCSVDCDNKKGGYLATQHLIENGCKKIAFLGGLKNGGETTLRLEGYKDALQKAGIEGDDSLISFGDYTGKAGFNRMSKWLENDLQIDGLFACSDLMAIGAIEAIRKKDLVTGKDIAVVGFDDTPMAEYCSPPLTTISQNIAKIGNTTVNNLIANINDGIVSKTILPVELIVRQSSTLKK